MNIIEIPVSNKNQQFNIQLGGKYYRIRLVYREFCGWVADFMTQTGDTIFTGVPLVSGVDILEPYRYIGIKGGLAFYCENPENEKEQDELGIRNRLYFIYDE